MTSLHFALLHYCRWPRMQHVCVSITLSKYMLCLTLYHFTDFLLHWTVIGLTRLPLSAQSQLSMQLLRIARMSLWHFIMSKLIAFKPQWPEWSTYTRGWRYEPDEYAVRHRVTSLPRSVCSYVNESGFVSYKCFMSEHQLGTSTRTRISLWAIPGSCIDKVCVYLDAFLAVLNAGGFSDAACLMYVRYSGGGDADEPLGRSHNPL